MSAHPTEPVIAAGRSAGYDVTVEAHAEGGRWEIDAVVVRRSKGGKPVTAEDIRAVRILEVLGPTVTTRNRALKAAAAAAEADAARLRAQGPTDETLQAVAAVYRCELGSVYASPTKAVEVTLGIARSTAGRWVARARERGHLGPAQGAGRRAG